MYLDILFCCVPGRRGRAGRRKQQHNEHQHDRILLSTSIASVHAGTAPCAATSQADPEAKKKQNPHLAQGLTLHEAVKLQLPLRQLLRQLALHCK